MNKIQMEFCNRFFNDLNCQIEDLSLLNLKIHQMKKLFKITMVMAVISSCSGLVETQNGELETIKTEEGNLYYITIEGENGDETKQEIEFSIDRVIVDSLKMNPEQIRMICDEAAIYADWNAKFKPTYKHQKVAMLVYNAKEKCIIANMSGTAENAYGTPDNLSSSIPFSLKGEMKTDEEGMPTIF
jgi:hypothetical protein